MKNEKETMVKCPRCKTCSQITELKVRPVGYKGKTEYYSKCEHCGTQVIVPEKLIPKVVRRKLLAECMV